MTGTQSWSYRPYARVNEPERARLPFICRIEPLKCGFELEWIDNTSPDTPHSVNVTERGVENASELVCNMTGHIFRVTGIKDLTDYDIYVSENQTGRRGSSRIVRTGAFPCKVVCYNNPDDGTYDFSGRSLISPSLCRLPSGRLLAAIEIGESRSDFPPDTQASLLYCSDDGGESWRYLSDIVPAIWAKPFIHRGRLYMIACEKEYGSIVISESTDEGVSWAFPKVLFFGEGRRGRGWIANSHAPIELDGRLYFTAEYGTEVHLHHEPTDEERAAYRSEFWMWMGIHVCTDFIMTALSCNADADITNPSSWHRTEPFFQPVELGWTIEGNIFKTPDGKIKEMIRSSRALVTELDPSNPDGPMKFDSYCDGFTLALSRFIIRFDETSGKYIAIGNEMYGELDIRGRTVISMAVSDDCESWSIVHRHLDCRGKEASFAYPYWVYDGDDIIMTIRTAWNGASNWHDTNAMMFSRIKDFRQYI